TAIQVGIEPWVIPAKAKDPAAGAAIFRWMTSPENAAKFTEEKGTLMAVKVADTVKYPPHLERAATVFNASKTKWSADFRQWYPELGKEAENAMAALLNGTVTPEQFAERVEKAAQAVRDNPNIIKHTVE
ncbi:MAG: extracellular solute-binding protein, partial [Fimbriimonadaceae bacterium]|nr:extracellular solute-binding protein [Fimbriimonadaceae bacterium]